MQKSETFLFKLRLNFWNHRLFFVLERRLFTATSLMSQVHLKYRGRTYLGNFYEEIQKSQKYNKHVATNVLSPYFPQSPLIKRNLFFIQALPSTENIFIDMIGHIIF